MWEGQLPGRQSFGGRCEAAGSPGTTNRASVSGAVGARHCRQAALQLW